jgi:hypothetical protein
MYKYILLFPPSFFIKRVFRFNKVLLGKENNQKFYFFFLFPFFSLLVSLSPNLLHSIFYLQIDFFHPFPAPSITSSVGQCTPDSSDGANLNTDYFQIDTSDTTLSGTRWIVAMMTITISTQALTFYHNFTREVEFEAGVTKLLWLDDESSTRTAKREETSSVQRREWPYYYRSALSQFVVLAEGEIPSDYPEFSVSSSSSSSSSSADEESGSVATSLPAYVTYEHEATIQIDPVLKYIADDNTFYTDERFSPYFPSMYYPTASDLVSTHLAEVPFSFETLWGANFFGINAFDGTATGETYQGTKV